MEHIKIQIHHYCLKNKLCDVIEMVQTGNINGLLACHDDE